MASEPTRSSGLDATVPAKDEGEAPAAAPPAEARYRLGDELGRGGMGRVVEAYDTHLGRTVALKEVLPQHSANMAKRFQREVRITARLEHASIVPLYDSGVMADGRPYYVMRRVSGKPLDELIARSRNLEERLALLPNVLGAIDAIAHAHKRGVIHRDIKPANILVGELGETVVIDWGLAKVVGEEEPPPPSFEKLVPPTAADSLQTHVGSVFGTPGFMAPEQARGDELGPHSDVFALGATLYQLIAGRPPVTGTSATQVIVSTILNKIVPVTTICPGAPPELATIIAKALAFEADKRYPDATALAGDVRAFMTGQLVAAHRYTRIQRLARFARRHRAALSVAALAATAVAVLSWFSVHRIVKERDVANRARAEAEHQRSVADRSATEARQRADQLLLAHARGLVDTSPTEAIAVLEHMQPSTPAVLAEAKTIAKAAVARGVAWGVPSLPGFTTSFEITRDGTRLLQVNRDGTLQVVDLELRKQVAKLELGGPSRATWVDAGRLIFVDRDKQAPAIFDPARSSLEAIASAPVDDFAKTEGGELVAYVDDQKQVVVVDIAKRAVTPVWTKGNAGDPIAIAPDGGWLAFKENLGPKRSRLVVIDRAGKVLVERAGDPVALAVSPAGKLAVSFFEEIFEVTPAGATPAFAKVGVDAKAERAFQLMYRGELLQMVAIKNVLTWNGSRLIRSDDLGDTVYGVGEAAGGVMAASANDRAVHLLRDGMHLALPVTSAADGMTRVTAARGSHRVAATTKDAILVWDIRGLFPALDNTPHGLFVGNRRALVPNGMPEDWFVWDVETKERVPLKLDVMGIPAGWLVDEREARLIALMRTQTGTAVVQVRADGRSEKLLDDIGNGMVNLVEGDAIIYSVGKNKIFAKVGSDKPHELVSVHGEIKALTGRGKHTYAVLSATGELATGTFGGGNFERTQIDDLDKEAFIAAEPNGDVLVASGNRLLRWRTDVQQVARLPLPIHSMAPTKLGLYVTLSDRSLFFLPATGNQTPQRVPISQLAAIVADGRILVGTTPSTQIEIVEMPGLAKWTLPKLVTGMTRLTVSPDGERILQAYGASVLVWKPPVPGSDFATWLDELTNADERDGNIRWPWQP